IAQAQLTPNEQAFLLADMAWRVDRESAARKYLRKLDVDAKDAARPLSLSVVLHHHAAEYEAARKLAEQAIALAADDAVVLANLSHWQWDSYCNAQVHGTDGRVRLDAVRSYATEALRLDPGSLAARKYLWLALLEQGDRPAALRTMTGAYELEPRNRDLNLAMGRFLAESSEPAHALPFLERALGWSHVDEERDEVEALIVAVATGKPVPRAPACSSPAGEWR
ncbi:MAG TPA: hypothetical protein VFY03_01845, partial [Woeseiaceae bacterium]|nr:hypothetical protein [Woeseiaceae bacterium]